jgi:hypothetical protein
VRSSRGTRTTDPARPTGRVPASQRVAPISRQASTRLNTFVFAFVPVHDASQHRLGQHANRYPVPDRVPVSFAYACMCASTPTLRD